MIVTVHSSLGTQNFVMEENNTVNELLTLVASHFGYVKPFWEGGSGDYAIIKDGYIKSRFLTIKEAKIEDGDELYFADYGYAV